MLVNSFVFSILIFCTSVNYAQPTYVKDTAEWELLIFTQQWPATVCKEWKHNPAHKCLMPSEHDSWTIHGIWPTKLGTIGPSFCNRSWHFDPEAIRPIETPLTQLWTNIEVGTTAYSLWAHEWTKHGTCAAILEPLNSELKYFSQGLTWLKDYSMTNVLKEAGIIPSNDKVYPVIDIHNAVRSKLGVNPAIECREEDGKNWLIEIRVCFDKSLNLTNCDGVVSLEPKTVISQLDMAKIVLTNCGTSHGIFYPPYEIVQPPNRLYLQLYKFVSWLQWFTL